MRGELYKQSWRFLWEAVGKAAAAAWEELGRINSLSAQTRNHSSLGESRSSLILVRVAKKKSKKKNNLTFVSLRCVYACGVSGWLQSFPPLCPRTESWQPRTEKGRRWLLRPINSPHEFYGAIFHRRMHTQTVTCCKRRCIREEGRSRSLLFSSCNMHHNFLEPDYYLFCLFTFQERQPKHPLPPPRPLPTHTQPPPPVFFFPGEISLVFDKEIGKILHFFFF